MNRTFFYKVWWTYDSVTIYIYTYISRIIKYRERRHKKYTLYNGGGLPDVVVGDGVNASASIPAKLRRAATAGTTDNTKREKTQPQPSVGNRNGPRKRFVRVYVIQGESSCFPVVPMYTKTTEPSCTLEYDKEAVQQQIFLTFYIELLARVDKRRSAGRSYICRYIGTYIL